MKNKKFKLGIWGWWQGHNLGDNWIKNVLKKAFPFAEFVPTKVRTFHKYDFMICGGGGLFIYDVIPPWDKLENINIPYGVLGLGAEFPHETNRAKEMEDKAEFFFVRDDYSVNCMGVSEKAKSYDCTFIQPLVWNELQDMDLGKLFFVWRDGHELLENDKFNNYIQHKDHVETAWNSLIRENFTEIISDDFQTTEADIEERITNSGFVISGRFHGIVAAIQKGIPFIAIDVCPKIRVLTEDAGLSEYCVKISEIDKVEELIKKARLNVEEIRSKEAAYRTKAHEKMQSDVNAAYEAIFRNCKPMRALYYKHFSETQDERIKDMVSDLANLCEVKNIENGVKVANIAPETTVARLEHKRVVKDVLLYRPDLLVLDSEEILLEDKTKAFLEKSRVKVIKLSSLSTEAYTYGMEGWIGVLRESAG